MIAIVVCVSIAVLAAGYFTYGRVVARWLRLDDSRVLAPSDPQKEHQ